MLTKKKLMKGVKKVISILVRIISIIRMKLLMLPKAKKPDILLAKWVYTLVYLLYNYNSVSVCPSIRRWFHV